MEGLEEKLGAVLNNPQMMQNLMQMAQSLGSSAPQEPQTVSQPENAVPDLGIDLGTLQKISAMASSSGIDAQQKNLLNALGPYLQGDRISRLEKAMRAAKLARMATSTFSGGIPFLGR